MLSKTKIQLIQSLQQKKYRKQYELFIAEGEKVVSELLQSSFPIHSVYALKSWINENAVSSSLLKEKLFEVSDNDLKKISSLSTPNVVLALANTCETTISVESLKNQLTLVLDGINDPGNMGTIIRIADWFGIKNIVCSTTTVDVFNSKTVQSAMGSIFRTNIIYRDLKEWISEYKTATGNAVYGTVLNGTNIYETKLDNKCLIIIGSESHGISNDLLGLIDKAIKIPSFSTLATSLNVIGEINSHLPNQTSEAESLNAAVAAAVVIAEFRRVKT